MPQPLADYTIVEMGTAIQGPAAGVYLSDMGADVIKVEPPIGDSSRFHRGVNNSTPLDTPGSMFIAGNRGKRSICVDVNTDAGIEIIRRLLKTADVFMSNYRAPFLNRLGLDYDSVRELNPDLIYAAVNGFGSLGPDADQPMVEGAVQARGGLASMCGPADGLPMPSGATIADAAGAMQFALGIVTALLAKERHGVSQQVSTSSLGAQIWLQSWEIQHCILTNQPLARDGSHMPNIRGPWGVYAASDGETFIFTLIGNSAWGPFCEFGGLPELAKNPFWDDGFKRMGAFPNDNEVVDKVRDDMRKVFANRTSIEWLAFFAQQDDIIVQKVQNHAEVILDPQTVANEYVVPMVFDGVGDSMVVGNSIQLSQTPGTVKGAPPKLGDATNDVMQKLGYSKEEISAVEQHTAGIRNRFFGAQ
jgi:crotonobetainyl-CoA:carnitine CoA-transferase CaiB-like acyl-CoA transferase